MDSPAALSANARLTLLLAALGFSASVAGAADGATEIPNVTIRRDLPAGVRVELDLQYVTDGHERQRLDLFLPSHSGATRPLIVWIHGGAWMMGDKRDCPLMAHGYLERGYAVASVGYRLSQHARFPAQLEDCKAAIRWLRSRADEYDLDPTHIGVMGPSAGGHLVAMLGTTGDIRTFDVGENLEFASAVQAVVDYFGPTDFTQMDAHAPPGATFRHNTPDSPESRLVGAPIDQDGSGPLAARANPVVYVTRAAPPFLIVHGNIDPVVPYHQSELLYAALVDKGVPVHFVTVRGGGHGDRFPASALESLVADFFDRHLKNQRERVESPVNVHSELVASDAP